MLAGINLMAWSDRVGPEELRLLPWLREIGYDGVEIPLLDLDRVDVPAIQSALADTGLRCTASTALPAGASLVDPAGVAAGVAFIRRCLEIGASLGAEVLCGPLYTPVGQRDHPPTGDERASCIDALRGLATLAEQTGVRLAIEPINRFETSFLNTVSDAVALVQAVDAPAVGILADTFHMNIEEQDPVQAIRDAGLALAHVHYSENDRGTIGTGHIPWPNIHRALRESGYDRWVVFETFAGHLPQLAAATAIWRPLVPSPEAYAVESLRGFRTLDSSTGNEETTHA